MILSNHHALPRSKTVGLQHHRIPECGQRATGFPGILNGPEPGRRNPQLFHKALGMDLAPLKCRIFRGWTHNSQAALPKLINHPVHQWTFRPHNSQVDPFPLRELDIIQRIRAIDRTNRRRPLQAPSQRMLPPAISNYQDFHGYNGSNGIVRHRDHRRGPCRL